MEVGGLSVEVVAILGCVVEGRGEGVFGAQRAVETVKVRWDERGLGVEREGVEGGVILRGGVEGDRVY